MGGYGSGRHSERLTVENGLTLDINQLLRQRGIQPGSHVSGSLTWEDPYSEEIASIGYEASVVNPTAAWVRLHYTANGTGMDYRVKLEATPCHYGGVRWWWRCPVSGRRATKLYLPLQATVFAARETHQLAYGSQREAAIARTHARQARLSRKLGGKGDDDERLPPPPKGMHRTTYHRLTTELCAAMDAYDAAFLARASALVARIEKVQARRRR